MGKVSRQCSWCYGVNHITPGEPFICPQCHHRADVSRGLCDCIQCKKLFTPEDMTLAELVDQLRADLAQAHDAYANQVQFNRRTSAALTVAYNALEALYRECIRVDITYNSLADGSQVKRVMEETRDLLQVAGRDVK